MRVPVRCPQPGEGRNQVNILPCIRFLGERPGVCGGLDYAKPVTQPLYGSARHEDTAFHRVGHLTLEPVTHRGEQPVP